MSAGVAYCEPLSTLHCGQLAEFVFAVDRDLGGTGALDDVRMALPAPGFPPAGMGPQRAPRGDPRNASTSWHKIRADEPVGPIRTKSYLPAEILRAFQ